MNDPQPCYRVTASPDRERGIHPHGVCIGGVAADLESAGRRAARMSKMRGGTFQVWEAGDDGLPVRLVMDVSASGCAYY